METEIQEPKKKCNKEYNKNYYEKNKTRIMEMLGKKEQCPKCGRMVAHQNIPKHQNTNYCISRSQRSKLESMENQINELKIKLDLRGLKD